MQCLPPTLTSVDRSLDNCFLWCLLVFALRFRHLPSTSRAFPRRDRKARARTSVEVGLLTPGRTAHAGDSADDCSFFDAYSLPLLARLEPAPVHALLFPFEPVHPLAAIRPRLLAFWQFD